ncbi:MAG: electron transfer flavoprotein subunit beta/FixA family protein [Gammaproteobacteria bacterium]|nr:electron transfer flavoprotein subunit beta/FixA family protein [Gammaproteobacteria bacterium]MCH9743751.1 electron transfer flavoprotein subunit beta/FixA family protein [Gammaproteobacteria bacterium]
MKILVPVKRVVDYHVKVRVKPDGSAVETQNVKHAINPFDEIALEEAVRLKEQGIANEVVAVSIGGAICEETLRHALAMGVDKAVLVETETVLESLGIAKVLHAIVSQQSAELVIMGKQAIDDDCNQTGQMLAALLNWPQGTFASKLKIKDSTAEVTREVDDGLEVLRLQLPCVITTDLRLNEPRYIKLPNIMKAKQKSIDKVAFSDLDLNIKPHVSVTSVETPPKRKAGVKVADFAELMQKLQQEAKVL